MPRLLVVDDDPQVRQLVPRLAYALVGKALEVYTASDLGEARSICQAGDVSVVLSDYFLPETDGPELLRHLRESFPHVRTVLMTGDASIAGTELPESALPVRDKADLEAIVREAVELALEGL